MLIHNADITGSLLVNGIPYNTGSFSGSFTGIVAGTTATASYVEYTNVANKPTLVSGSAQISEFGIFATTGSNGFNGSQSITGSLTVTGQVVAQTLNVQQVTSSVVYSSGSNIFGNELGNTQQFTGSVGVTGSLTVNGALTGTSASFSGLLNLDNPTSLALSINSTTNNPYIRFQQSGATKFFIGERSAVSGDGGTGYDIYAVAGNDLRFFAGASKALTLASTGAAIFNTTATTAVSAISTGTASGLQLTNSGGTASSWIIQSDGGAVAGQAALRFYSLTASAYRMSIDGNGNVGIGTLSPSAKLQVNGNVRLYTTSGDGNELRGIFNVGGAADPLSFEMYKADAGTIGIYLTADGSTYFNGGSVGIGYTSPTYPLQVLNNIGLRANSQNFQAIKGTGWGYNTSAYRVVMLGDNNTANATTVSIGYDPSGNVNGAFTGDGREVLFRRGAQFVTPNSSNDSFYLYNLVLLDGKVGIGTASPNSKLEVVDGTGSVFRAINSGTNIMEIGNYKPTDSGGAGYQQLDIVSSILAFYTGTAGGGSATERMRITSAGNVIIGNTTAYGGLTVSDFTSNDGNDSLAFFYRGTSGGHESLIKFYDFRGQVNAAIGNNLQDDGIGTQKARLVFKTSNSGAPTERMRIESFGGINILNSYFLANSSVGYRFNNQADTFNNVIFYDNGNVSIRGALSKGSGSFKIDHPLPSKKDTHHLVHSFIEGPQADNIYRGKIQLVNGKATINLDQAARMTEGTFVLLNGNIQCFTSNESGWTAVKGIVEGNILTIEAQDTNCADTISWLVVGERIDQHMLDTDWTDENGKVITEPLKQQ